MELAALMAIASPQYGCFTRVQALDVMSKRQLGYLIEAGIVTRVHPQVFSITGSNASWYHNAKSATLSVPGSALSHGAAAKLWKLSFAAHDAIEITTPCAWHAKRPRVLVHKSDQLTPFVTQHDNLPVTTVARTIVDVSTGLTWRQIGAIIDQARILKLATAKDVERCLAAMKTRGRSRVANVRLALEPRLKTDKDMDSFLERRTLAWIRDNGFPEPETQVWFAGRRRYRLDIWYPEWRIDIEPDGPHHLLPSVAFEDRKRDLDLTIRGVIVIRVPIEMEEPEFVATLRPVIASQSRPGVRSAH